MIIKQSKVPVIVDAGLGTASDATVAMELGCDGVLINSAIAMAKKPIAILAENMARSRFEVCTITIQRSGKAHSLI